MLNILPVLLFHVKNVKGEEEEGRANVSKLNPHLRVLSLDPLLTKLRQAFFPLSGRNRKGLVCHPEAYVFLLP